MQNDANFLTVFSLQPINLRPMDASEKEAQTKMAVFSGSC